MGALCTVCAPGYGKIRALECGKCPDKATNTGYYTITGLGQLVSLLFTVRATIAQNSGGTKPPLYGQILKCADTPPPAPPPHTPRPVLRRRHPTPSARRARPCPSAG